MFTLNRTIVVGVDTAAGPLDTVPLGAIDGEVVREVLIRYWINNDDAGAGRDFKLYPNGVVGNTASVSVGQTGTGVNNRSREVLSFVNNSLREFFCGYLRLQTELSPGSTSLETPRRFEGFTTLGDDPLVESTTGFVRSNGGWDFGDGALTSLDIVATTANTSTLAAAIGDGSIFQVWYLAPS